MSLLAMNELGMAPQMYVQIVQNETEGTRFRI